MMAGEDFAPEIAQSLGFVEAGFPNTKEELELAESVLANSLEKLSLQEQEKIIFDKHGLPLRRHEDPVNVEELLQELEQELQTLPYSDKQAYQEAETINPAYVQNAKFRLLFLRVEDFRVQDAAKLLVQHFEVKQELFCGKDPQILARDVEFCDLSKEQQSYLRQGAIQIMEKKDVGGRTIMCTSPGSISHELTYASMNELVWYSTMACLRQEETSRKGMVIVVFNYNALDENFDVSKSGNRVRAAMPIRIVASHYCFSNPALRPYLAGIRLNCAKLRFVLQPHFGSPDEIDFALQTYGIPMDVCPMSKDGSWTVRKGHTDWLEQQIQFEQSTSGVSIDDGNLEESQPITRTLKQDVLFGRTKESRDHPGNKQVQLWVQMHFDEYEKASKQEKVGLAEKIFDMVSDSGGRFLEQETRKEDEWSIADNTRALRKIAHYFRRERERIREGVEETKRISAKRSSTSPVVDQVDLPRKRK